MLAACLEFKSQDIDSLIMSAAVCDWEPEKTLVGKVKSQDKLWQLSLKPCSKILSYFGDLSAVKVAFKLENELGLEEKRKIAQNYFEKYKLNLLLMNTLSEVEKTNHKATLFDAQTVMTTQVPRTMNSKKEIATTICQYIHQELKRQTRRI